MSCVAASHSFSLEPLILQKNVRANKRDRTAYEAAQIVFKKTEPCPREVRHTRAQSRIARELGFCRRTSQHGAIAPLRRITTALVLVRDRSWRPTPAVWRPSRRKTVDAPHVVQHGVVCESSVSVELRRRALMCPVEAVVRGAIRVRKMPRRCRYCWSHLRMWTVSPTQIVGARALRIAGVGSPPAGRASVPHLLRRRQPASRAAPTDKSVDTGDAQRTAHAE